MAMTAVALCSRALLKLGATPIASFEDGTAEAELAGALYPPLRDALLSAHAWNFATAQASLPRLLEAPLADYAYAYQLPVDFLRALSAGVSGRGRGLAYRISGRMLHTDSPAVVLTYLFRPPEADFPALFDHVLIARLAAEFCIPLTENASRAETLLRAAEQDFRAARLVDAQQDTPVVFEDFALISARA